jgi:hypothetical protein
MSQLIRWVLILPAAIAAWYLALFIGVALYRGAEALCPASQVVSGQCFAPWFLYVSEGLIAFGAALAAALIMITCAWLAPTHKRQVSIATFALGAGVAIIMGLSAHAYAAIAAAIIAGAIILVVLLRRLPPLTDAGRTGELRR